MKRKFELIGAVAAAALALSACNREGLTPSYNAGNDAIAFDTYAGGVTKTAALTTANLSTFGAAAYTGSVEIMNNQLVEGGNGAWNYTPIKYWPQSGALYFSAYAPYASASNGITPSYNTSTRSFDLTYVMPADEADQVDLLMAQNVDVADCSNRPAKVQFTFGHILSRIGLTARYKGTNVAAGTTVTLTDVKVSGKFMASGDYIVSGGWSNQVASASTVIYDRPAEKLDATGLTTSAQNLLAGDNYVMVIPNGSVAMEGTITVSYTVRTSDGVEMQYVKDASSPLNYEPNKTYMYNLIIDLDADAIEFGDVTVLDWGTTVEQDVEVRAYSGNIQVVGLSFSPFRRNAQFFVRSFAEYEDGETTNVPWHAEFSTDGGNTYSKNIPVFFDSIQNNGDGTDTYSATSHADIGEYVDVKFIQDVENGASVVTRANVLPVIETRDSLIRGYHLRNAVLIKDGDDYGVHKVDNPVEYLDWANNNIQGRYFQLSSLIRYFNVPTFPDAPISMQYSNTLDYTNYTIPYNNDIVIVPTPADWFNMRAKPTDKGTLINGMSTTSHYAMIQLDLSETEYADLTNGTNNANKGYLNGLLMFPDDATIYLEQFSLTCDNNNDCPLNNAINFTVYDCTKNKLSVLELKALMNGGCVFLPCIWYNYNLSVNGGTGVEGWNYSMDGIFCSGTRSMSNTVPQSCMHLSPFSLAYDLYEVRGSGIQAPQTLIYLIPQQDSREANITWSPVNP